MGSSEEVALPRQIREGIWPASNERGFTIDERPAFSSIGPKKIIGIGAGMAGINLALQVSRSAANFELKLFEKAETSGGNWLWNQYPGVACDNPGVTYQFINDPIPNWNRFYSTGSQIRDYLQGLIHKNSLEKYFQYNTEVTRAEWSDEKSQWTVTLKDLKTGNISTQTADVLVGCEGPLHYPNWPSLKNQSAYKGHFVHNSRYPENLNLKDKRVAVLGTGASGIQILPAILDDASKVYHWIRQPTYILPQDATRGNFEYTEEQQTRFAEDSTYYLKYRKALEHRGNQVFSSLLKGTDESKHVTELCVQNMKKVLASRPDIIDKLIPKTFSFGCRRPTPGPGYLEALCNPKVEVFLSEMQEMTEAGFIDHEGKEHEVDVFICATGYDASYVPHYPIIARGVNLQDKWSENDPDCYLSMAIPGFPNYFLTRGPWGPNAHGSSMPLADIVISTILEVIRKMADEQIVCLEPTEEATSDYLEYATLWLKRCVLSEPCRAWLKSSKTGRPLCFPGSRVLFIEAMSKFRPEDWKYKYVQSNRFRHWGNGFHPNEIGNVDDTHYLGLLNGQTTLPDYGSIIEENAPEGRRALERARAPRVERDMDVLL